MPRRSISAKERVAILKREGGLCHMCGGIIHSGELWEVSHEIPLELGGADDDVNRKAAHKVCHRDHTAKVDIPAIAKAKRREASALGIRSDKPKINSPGFPQTRDPARITKQSLPPLRLYQDA